MKLIIRNRHLPPINAIDGVIESRLIGLTSGLQVDEAVVLVEHRRNASPPYRVELHLAVPGPDLRAERIDHTPLQAFTRALDDIERKLRQRTRSRLSRPTANIQRSAREPKRAASHR
jgi:ribosome-associated translation inhibitor RaiA